MGAEQSALACCASSRDSGELRDESDPAVDGKLAYVLAKPRTMPGRKVRATFDNGELSPADFRRDTLS